MHPSFKQGFEKTSGGAPGGLTSLRPMRGPVLKGQPSAILSAVRASKHPKASVPKPLPSDVNPAAAKGF
jgi:hypothetical protein